MIDGGQRVSVDAGAKNNVETSFTRKLVNAASHWKKTKQTALGQMY